MATLEEKQIAKEILIELIRKDDLYRKEYPNVKTVSEMTGLAYGEILKVISKSE